MSWHHEDYISLISAIGGMVAAASAAFAAVQSSRSAKTAYLHQKDVANFERIRHLRELLRLETARANETISNTNSEEWTQDQIANIVNALESSKQRIIEAKPYILEAEEKEMRSYVKSQLKNEIKKAFSKDNPPKSISISGQVTPLSIETNARWRRNRSYFELDKVRLEDLKL